MNQETLGKSERELRGYPETSVAEIPVTELPAAKARFQKMLEELEGLGQ